MGDLSLWTRVSSDVHLVPDSDFYESSFDVRFPVESDRGSHLGLPWFNLFGFTRSCNLLGNMPDLRKARVLAIFFSGSSTCLLLSNFRLIGSAIFNRSWVTFIWVHRSADSLASQSSYLLRYLYANFTSLA